mmetsp:Transcript_17044/g.27197  ORF Transcript_17044/g.27197 Transcript_17044/m.27197 type:complete len:228 (-) Transcript_17044:81-764(-)
MAEQKSNDDARITLGYWKICGLGNTARMLLVYANQPFNNVMYEQKGADQDYSRAEWNDVKFKIGLDFPNLPYLMDSKTNLKLTESRAIYRYLARQFNIGVQQDPELAIADSLCGIISDSMSAFGRLSYGTYPDGKDDYLNKQLPPKAAELDKFLSGKTYLCGNTISYADFHLYYFVFANLKLDQGWIKKYRNLQAFYDAFNKLEFMERWNKTEYGKLPLNNTVAKFR